MEEDQVQEEQAEGQQVGQQEERRFTQADIDRIVIERLARERKAAEEAREGIEKALDLAGFDLEAYHKAGKDKKAELLQRWQGRISDTRAELRALKRDAAFRELQLDPKKAGRILGDVQLTRKTVALEDGGEAELWGAYEGETFKSVQRLIEEAGWAMDELAPRLGAKADGWRLDAGQITANALASDNPLAFLDN